MTARDGKGRGLRHHSQVAGQDTDTIAAHTIADSAPPVDLWKLRAVTALAYNEACDVAAEDARYDPLATALRRALVEVIGVPRGYGPIEEVRP